MPSETPSRRQRLGISVPIGVVGVFAVAQFVAADPRPWGVAAGWAAVTALLLGPVAWLARYRLPPDRRETLTYVAGGGAILLASLLLGVSLAFEPAFFPYGPGFLVGIVIGTLLVLLAERAIVPDRLRSSRI